MANKRGSIRKQITLGALIMAGLEIAPENAIQYKKDLPAVTGMDILTLYTRVKELGFEIVPILALRPIKEVKNDV